MHKIFHHFRRNRTYDRRDRWTTVAILAGLTIAVSAGSWLLWGKPARSATDLFVTQLDYPLAPIAANGVESAPTTIVIKDDQGQAAANIWVGLLTDDEAERTPELTYEGWYSPEPNRAFFKTDAEGKVTFALKSRVAGDIEYKIYSADPEIHAGMYQDLHKSFMVSFR